MRTSTNCKQSCPKKHRSEPTALQRPAFRLEPPFQDRPWQKLKTETPASHIYPTAQNSACRTTHPTAIGHSLERRELLSSDKQSAPKSHKMPTPSERSSKSQTGHTLTLALASPRTPHPANSNHQPIQPKRVEFRELGCRGFLAWLLRLCSGSSLN